MKTYWLLPLLSLPIALASPTEQIPLGDVRVPTEYSSAKNVADQFLSDAKKAILKGKENMQNWYHDGKEYIKQNNLLCENSFPESRHRLTRTLS